MDRPLSEQLNGIKGSGRGIAAAYCGIARHCMLALVSLLLCVMSLCNLQIGSVNDDLSARVLSKGRAPEMCRVLGR